MHALLSATLQIPELALADEEGKALANALANLQRFYPVHVTEKALAWSNMLSAVGMIYGTRVGAYTTRRATERKTAGPTNVIRPQQFSQARQPSPNAQPIQQPVIQTPDGDPVQAAPNAATARAMDATERLFQNTPPEMI